MTPDPPTRIRSALLDAASKHPSNLCDVDYQAMREAADLLVAQQTALEAATRPRESKANEGEPRVVFQTFDEAVEEVWRLGRVCGEHWDALQAAERDRDEARARCEQLEGTIKAINADLRAWCGNDDPNAIELICGVRTTLDTLLGEPAEEV